MDEIVANLNAQGRKFLAIYFWFLSEYVFIQNRILLVCFYYLIHFIMGVISVATIAVKLIPKPT